MFDDALEWVDGEDASEDEPNVERELFRLLIASHCTHLASASLPIGALCPLFRFCMVVDLQIPLLQATGLYIKRIYQKLPKPVDCWGLVED